MLPYMNDKSIMRPALQTGWGGINHNKSAQEGEIYDMMNMSSREYPLLAPRDTRIILDAQLTAPNGSGVLDVPFWIDGTDFVFDQVVKGQVYGLSALRSFAILGKKILIFPDKKYYDAEADRFGDLEAGGRQDDVTFMNGTYAGEPAEANTIYVAGVNWRSIFNEGDAVKIEGCYIHPENNATLIIREIDGDYLRFYENSFTLDSTIRYTATADGLEAGGYYFCIGEDPYSFTLTADMAEGDTLTWTGSALDAVIGGSASTIPVTSGATGTPLVFADIPTDYTEDWIVITRSVPDLRFVCVNDNRVWGTDGVAMYASKLGDPFNWNAFDGLSTDSWSSEVSEPGDFTGCISFQGYPTFFKEDVVYKVQGDKPSNYSWTAAQRHGVLAFAERSLTIVGETLFYLSRVGVCAYTGGAPSVISAPLGIGTYGDDYLRYAVGGTDGVRYYLAIQGGASTLYAYDTRYGTWHIEDQPLLGYNQDNEQWGYYGVDSFFRFRGAMYALMQPYAGRPAPILCCSHSPQIYQPAGYSGAGWVSYEDPVEWMVEFADAVNFYETTRTGSENKKGLLRLQVRAALEEDAIVKFSVSYDDGAYTEIGQMKGTSGKKKSYNLPTILRRCDHYRLKIEGTGDCVIYSIAAVRYSGSNLQGSSLYTPEEA